MAGLDFWNLLFGICLLIVEILKKLWETSYFRYPT